MSPSDTRFIPGGMNMYSATRVLAPDVVAPLPDRVAPLPDYLVKTYSWAYLRPRSLRLLDRPAVINSILWGNYCGLVRDACDEFAPGDRVLQAASVYGDLSSRLAARIGSEGHLDVNDIAPIQVEHCRRKLAGRFNVTVRVADAASPGPACYDGVCCFFLLHEVPDLLKRRIVNALLVAVNPGGKIVFVDYHRPRWWHPLRPVMSLVFRWLEPYADGLVSRSIMEFAERPQDFKWQKRTRFGGLYQIVVVTRPH